MIPLALKQIGVDASGFRGVCARRGGITTAIEAHVPEHVLWMQSGHAQTRAARQYVVLSSMIRSCCFRLSRPSDCKVVGSWTGGNFGPDRTGDGLDGECI